MRSLPGLACPMLPPAMSVWAAMGQHESVLAIDLENLERDVAPSLAVEGGISGRVRRGLDDQHGIAREEGHRAAGASTRRQAKRLRIEAAMRCDVANAEANSD